VVDTLAGTTPARDGTIDVAQIKTYLGLSAD
jgi:hypothetical protein